MKKFKRKNREILKNIPTIVVNSPSASTSNISSELVDLSALPPSYSSVVNQNSTPDIKEIDVVIEHNEDQLDDVAPLPEQIENKLKLRRNSISLPNLDNLELQIISNCQEQQVCTLCL